jgi:hypothetical protein
MMFQPVYWQRVRITLSYRRSRAYSRCRRRETSVDQGDAVASKLGSVQRAHPLESFAVEQDRSS